MFTSTYLYGSPKYSSGSPRVEVHWLSKNALAIDFDGAATVGKALSQFDGIRITYRRHLDW